MATTVLQDPGYGGSARAVADILKLAGAHEKERQKGLATKKIIDALSSDDPNALKVAMREATQFTAEPGDGVTGLLQRIGASQMRGAPPGVEALTETGLPMAELQSQMRQRKDYGKYLRGEGRQTARTSDPYAQLRALEEAIAIHGQGLPEGADRRKDPVQQAYRKRWQSLMDELNGAAGTGAIEPPQYQPEPGAVKSPVKPGMIPTTMAPTGGITQTATNPQTGERIGWDGTKWIPLQ